MRKILAFAVVVAAFVFMTATAKTIRSADAVKMESAQMFDSVKLAPSDSSGNLLPEMNIVAVTLPQLKVVVKYDGGGLFRIKRISSDTSYKVSVGSIDRATERHLPLEAVWQTMNGSITSANVDGSSVYIQITRGEANILCLATSSKAKKATGLTMDCEY